MTKATPLLPHLDELRKRFRYDPETGAIWHAGMGSRKHMNRAKIGDRADRAGKNGYLRVSGVDRRHIRAHRLAWVLHYGAEPLEVDHINGIRHDNRIANLRSVTATQNRRNAAQRSRPVNPKLPAGLHRRYGTTWEAYLRAKSGTRLLARFDCPAMAACWLDQQRREHGYSPRHGLRQN